jgi:two-component system, NarL family, nitrate/nitrite response regulator NarL
MSTLRMPLSAAMHAPTPSAALRIVVADDHPLVRLGVRMLLSAETRFAVVGEANSLTSAVDQTLLLHPDILFLDVRMPGGQCAKTLLMLREQAPQVKVIILTGEISAGRAAEMFDAGASGLILKSAMSETIAPALLTVHEGAFWALGRRYATRDEVMARIGAAAKTTTAPVVHLTPRELEVIGLIVKGLSNRDIAGQFKLSEETVKRHLTNIFDKLGVSTRLELAILAIERKLVVREAAN